MLHALYELLRGFQAAHEASGGELLRQPLAEHPDDVYRALLTVILRLVFLLYAEEREMLPDDETFLRYYSLAGLYERLREDAARYPDTMDQRYGAWAQLLALFRMVHDGAHAGEATMPARHGELFDPDRYPFLEGRPAQARRQIHERIEPPLVPDGTIYRVLEKLLVLDGERLSYRALDVEQIGSVYETMMGFRLEQATGRSVAIRAQKPHGAPTTIDLEALLAESQPTSATKWLQDHADRKLTPTGRRRGQGRAATSTTCTRRSRRDRPAATPDLVPPGAMVLQPSDERRRSGSHYTPRVAHRADRAHHARADPRRACAARRPAPTPEEILDLKVCDPAMGSGAFLVEACRQLGDALVEAWDAHGGRPAHPARRGRGDLRAPAGRPALPLRRGQEPGGRRPGEDVALAGDARARPPVHLPGPRAPPRRLARRAHRGARSRLPLEAGRAELRGDPHRPSTSSASPSCAGRSARPTRTSPTGSCATCGTKPQHELEQVRLFGDLAVAAFFSGDKPRRGRRSGSSTPSAVTDGHAPSEYSAAWLDELRARRANRSRRSTGRSSSPRYSSGRTRGSTRSSATRRSRARTRSPRAMPSATSTGSRRSTRERTATPTSSPTSSAAAFDLLRDDGAFGLDRHEHDRPGRHALDRPALDLHHGATIYAARKRVKWPGGGRGGERGPYDSRSLRRSARTRRALVANITAYLFHAGRATIRRDWRRTPDRSFQGTIVFGIGFTFDDTDAKGVATSVSEMRRLIEQDPWNARGDSPYIGGGEEANDPIAGVHRYRDRLLRLETRRSVAALADADGDRRREGEAGAGCAERTPSGGSVVAIR